MSSFTNELDVRIQADGMRGRLLSEFDYHVGSKEGWFVIHVPTGFLTDFASVPPGLWNLFPKWGRYSKAAVVHDYLYQSKIVSRAMADDIFREAMLVLGVPKWKTNLMYSGVRLFGWLGYAKNNLPEEKKP